MAYSDFLKERIEKLLMEKSVTTTAKKFMGGYCFFLDDKMFMGVNIDKITGKDRLLARIGDENMQTALKKKGCRPMDITGRPMKGFVFIDPEGFDLDSDLEYWVKLCIDHNPFAKKSKKRQ